MVYGLEICGVCVYVLWIGLDFVELYVVWVWLLVVFFEVDCFDCDYVVVVEVI